MTPTVVVRIVVTQAMSILLGRRKTPQQLAGLWEFPGGRLEYWERLEDGARRELLEETGLTAHEISLLGVGQSFIEGHGHFVEVIYSVTKWSGILKTMEPDKCHGWEWIDLGELPELNECMPPLQQFIEALQ